MLCGRPFPEYIKILELRQIDIRRVPDIGKITVAGLIVDSGCFKSCLLSGLKRMERIFKNPCLGRFRIKLECCGIIDIRLTLAAADFRTGKDRK